MTDFEVPLILERMPQCQKKLSSALADQVAVSIDTESGAQVEAHVKSYRAQRRQKS